MLGDSLSPCGRLCGVISISCLGDRQHDYINLISNASNSQHAKFSPEILHVLTTESSPGKFQTD